MAMNGPGFSVRSVVTNVTEAGFGTFSLKFDMFKDLQFTTKYSSFPVLVSLRDRLHFEIESDVSDRSIVLLIDSCYATPSINDKDDMKYMVIKDRCPSDATLKFHSPSGKPHAQCFSIEAFKFLTNSSTVYMHCKVFLCKKGSSHSQCNDGCAGNNLLRAKRSIQRREVNDVKTVSKIYQLDAGPIQQKPSAAAETRMSSRTILMGCGIAVLGLIVIGLVTREIMNRRRFLIRQTGGDKIEIIPIDNASFEMEVKPTA